MRILDKDAIPLNLTGLGLDERQSADLVESIHTPYGLALVTGPTGSGKSTTLYACLNLLNEPRHNICTVEDPVEYKFEGMNQVQVKVQVGLTFSWPCGPFSGRTRTSSWSARSATRRPPRSASAALTGHFVLSTIHTADRGAAAGSPVSKWVILACCATPMSTTLRIRRGTFSTRAWSASPPAGAKPLRSARPIDRADTSRRPGESGETSLRRP